MIRINKYIITFLLMVSLCISTLEAKNVEVETILFREKIDLDSKSLKGWIRVFNSESKLRDLK